MYDKSRTEIAVRVVRDQDEPTVLALLDAGFGKWPVVEGHAADIDPSAFFRWKHRASPFGQSRLLLAERAGSAVGFRAFMPWELRAGERRVRAMRTTDAVTHPSVQRAGIFGAIRREADRLFQDPVDLYFGTPNDKSLGATMKLGRRQVAGLLRVSTRLRPLRAVGAAVSRSSLPGRIEAATAGDALATSQEIEALLEEAQSAESRLATVRDLAYLRWRYAMPPLGYRAVCDLRGGRLCGIAFFRVRARRALADAVIEDMVVRPGDTRGAVRLLRAVARAAPAAVLSCSFPTGTSQRAAARRQRFLPWRGGLPLMVKRPEHEVLPPPEHLASWALTLGDFEVL